MVEVPLHAKRVGAIRLGSGKAGHGDGAGHLFPREPHGNRVRTLGKVVGLRGVRRDSPSALLKQEIDERGVAEASVSTVYLEAAEVSGKTDQFGGFSLRDQREPSPGRLVRAGDRDRVGNECGPVRRGLWPHERFKLCLAHRALIQDMLEETSKSSRVGGSDSDKNASNWRREKCPAIPPPLAGFRS